MCLHGALCSTLFNSICNMTTFRKKCFDLLTTVCVRTEYVIGMGLHGFTSTKQGLVCLVQGNKTVPPVGLEPTTF